MTKAKSQEIEKTERAALPPLWTYYRVAFLFLTRLCASVPADPELVKKWLEVRAPSVRAPGGLSIEEINEEVLASIERADDDEVKAYSLLVFQKHAGCLVMRYGTVRAHIKDCARVLSGQYIGRIPTERSFATRVINGVYLNEREYWLPIMRPTGELLATADGAFDKAVHVVGVGGRRMNALKRIEYVEPPALLTFTLKVLGRSISETDLHHIFTYGGTHGYAGERGDGEGRYTYTLERITEPAAVTAGAGVAG